MNDIFAIGTRKKLRFLYKGACSIEQLWDLSQEELDTIFVKLRDSKTENGLINYTKDKNNEETDLKMEIVKEIFQVKKMEADAQQIDIAKEKRREELIEAIKAKDSEDLRHMTREELENELKALESM